LRGLVGIPQECPFRKGVVGFVGRWPPPAGFRPWRLGCTGSANRQDGRHLRSTRRTPQLARKLVQESVVRDRRFARLGLLGPTGWLGHCPASGSRSACLAPSAPGAGHRAVSALSRPGRVLRAADPGPALCHALCRRCPPRSRSPGPMVRRELPMISTSTAQAAPPPTAASVRTPRELRHTFASVQFRIWCGGGGDRPSGRTLQLEDDRGHLPSRAPPRDHHRRRRDRSDLRLDHAALRGPGFPCRHCLSWNFRRILEDRACG
jgi:hypothetical protein